jgi:hypothetical protein
MRAILCNSVQYSVCDKHVVIDAQLHSMVMSVASVTPPGTDCATALVIAGQSAAMISSVLSSTVQSPQKLKVFKHGLLLASFSMSWSTATASPGLLMSDIPSSVPIELQCARLTGSGEIGA